MTERTLFEQNEMNEALRSYLGESYEEVLKEVSVPLTGWPKHVTVVRLDVLAVGQSGSLVVEIKINCTPYKITQALGQVRMQRIILREYRDYVEGKYDLVIREPIEIGVCFADLPPRYSETHKNKRWMMWNDKCTQLLDELREEPVKLFLIRTKADKPSYKELAPEDLEVVGLSENEELK